LGTEKKEQPVRGQMRRKSKRGGCSKEGIGRKDLIYWTNRHRLCKRLVSSGFGEGNLQESNRTYTIPKNRETKRGGQQQGAGKGGRVEGEDRFDPGNSVFSLGGGSVSGKKAGGRKRITESAGKRTVLSGNEDCRIRTFATRERQGSRSDQTFRFDNQP